MNTMQSSGKSNVKRSRTSVVAEAIHETAGPVFAYAKEIEELKGEPFKVVTIPEGSAAFMMGYRFVSIPETELEHYLANGAALAVEAVS